MALLGLALLIVGVTTEITLRTALYDRIDAQLTAAATRGPRGFGPGVGRPGDGQYGGGSPTASCRTGGNFGFPPGQTIGTLAARNCDGDITAKVLAEQNQDAPEVSDAAFSTLAGIQPGGRPQTVELGGSLGDYRVVSQQMNDGSIFITGLPLSDTQDTLYLVAGVVGGVLVIALIAIGAAGTVIVRRTLAPLERVAATATKVSELRLDRGEVDLAQRVPEGDTDVRTEVGQVGAALNKMLDHVGSALEARHASETQVRQFVADASHELRTPLAAIRGYAELSRRSRRPVPDEIAHVLRRVESEAQRMTALVEDLLLLARLDAGRPLAHDPVDLTMLVVDTVSDAHATGPGHDWQLDMPEEPVTVVGDPARLHQVLANLLANARTHTPEGTTVTVSVSATGHEALIRVTDAGPGIPADLLPHIFERFARGDSSRSRAAGSTGLGLSIVHAVVTAHGGTVGVESEPGRTEFTVRLPLALPAPADPVHQHVAQVVQ
ncbi:HAMP domain-containing sensor histidine kinase [Actinoplanes sp. NPDC051633]|uniref:sensor histidine kinase n=1 Tax=Actinoplanes sp. NPDC051633 TaxID=3155670 RepID=UPI0034142532